MRMSRHLVECTPPARNMFCIFQALLVFSFVFCLRSMHGLVRSSRRESCLLECCMLMARLLLLLLPLPLVPRLRLRRIQIHLDFSWSLLAQHLCYRGASLTLALDCILGSQAWHLRSLRLCLEAVLKVHCRRCRHQVHLLRLMAQYLMGHIPACLPHGQS